MSQPGPETPVDMPVDSDQVIRLMSESLANKIAAGEVVQRPASVVKELLENAIDAGADEITVRISGAGSDLIQVVDNGCGMSAADARACFQRHATSKIRSIDDLESIQTLGFRGEALASIAAISHVTLKTGRSIDNVGTEIVLEGGRLVKESPIPAFAGTSIAVRNLFYNVPARRKFLKRPATELKHVIETTEVTALANAHIGFHLQRDNGELLTLPRHVSDDPADSLLKRIVDVLPTATDSGLVHVAEATSYLGVSGFIGRPEIQARSRGNQFLFVNGRPIKHRSLEHAVFSAYEYLLPDGTYPLFVLFLDIDPRHIDVNVHPTKAEIKFDDESGVYGMLRTIVRKAIGTATMTPDFSAAKQSKGLSLDLDAYDSPRSSAATGSAGFSDLEDGRAREPNPKPWLDPGRLSGQLYDQSAIDRVPSGARDYRTGDERGDESEDLLWQLHDAYVLTQIRSGLVIVDQQAAHERILYEQAKRSLSDGFGLSQQLLFPTTIELSAGDFALLDDLAVDLRSLGFDIERFGGRTIVLRGVPADIRAGNERIILDEVIDQYKTFERIDSLKGAENLARSIARKSAVGPGTRLSHKEMRTLIDKLFLCETPWASPDGRPTIIRLSVDELRDRFSRSSS